MSDAYSGKPWLKSYDKNVPGKLTYPGKPYTELFDEAVNQFKDKVAVFYADMPVTYGQLDAMSNRFANFLQGQGLKPGDVVGVHLPSVLANYITLIGTFKSGCVFSGVSPLLTPRELEFQLNDSDVKVLVTLDVLWGNVSKAIGNTGVRAVVMVSVADFLPGFKVVLGKLLKKIPTVEIMAVPGIPMHNYMDVLKNSPATNPGFKPDTDAVCLLQYTGGTTGMPKGALITHRNFVSMLTQFGVWLDYKHGEETWISAFPMFHMAGIGVALLGLALGSTLVAVPNPRDVAGLVKAIKRYKPTVIVNVPTIYFEMLKQPLFSKIDFSRLKNCISGSIAMPPEFLSRLETIIGENKFVEVFGMTETSGGAIMSGPRYGKKKVGSVGLPWPDVEVKLIDPLTNQVALVGEPGEIVARGPQICTKGYLNRPEETSHALRDGWIYTGDVARMDEEGYFFIVDRTKDMVNVSGYKVFTRELDDLLLEHPAVALAASVGIPNPDRPGTEMVTSAIVVKTGVEKSDATRDSIIEFVRGRAAAYKVPRKIVFMDQLPTSAVGKIMKKDLREILKQ